MSNQWNERTVIDFIKQDLLLDRLELGDMGFTFDSISDDVLLLDDSGLALDSVDALDLIVGLERKFGFKVEQIDKSFIESKCQSLRGLTHYVLERLQAPVAR